jgi:hypothetical protein
MKKLLLGLLLALTSLSVLSAPRFTSGKDFVELGQDACGEDLLKIAYEKGLPKEQTLLSAKAVVDGVVYKACWTLEGNTVGLVYEDGDIGLVPAADFKESSI